MKKSKGRIVFEVINVIVLSLLSFACLFPLLNILAMSFSSSTAVAAGKVSIFPVEFNLYAYDYVVGKADFWKALLRSVERVAIGLPLNMILTIMLAYPLSKESTSFRMRTVYVWIFFFTMLFSGGLIPGYLLIQNLKMMDTIWALVLPAAVPVYNVILMLNFFRGIPEEIRESAVMDGASEFKIFTSIIFPLSMQVVSTVGLWIALGHWNSFYDTMLYTTDTNLWTLQYYLMKVIKESSGSFIAGMPAEMIGNISAETVSFAAIVISVIPILVVYPLIFKMLTKGVVIGSLKG